MSRPNIINYFESLLPKASKNKATRSANDLLNGSMKAWGEVIIGGGNADREYNKANLRIAFNRYDPGRLASFIADRPYLF